MKREIEYLGYTINANGVKPSDTNVRAILDFPQPKTSKEVHRFLGLASYFRKFVPVFALIARPLYALIKNEATFRFGELELRTFEKLRDNLVNFPVLAFYSPTAVMALHTDASSSGYGAILMQKQNDLKMNPVLYFSKRTAKTEVRYHIYELEMMAIVYALLIRST